VSGDELGELPLDAGEHVVELEGVGVQVDPLRSSSENCECLSGPETV
jgi:hypothetical protein